MVESAKSWLKENQMLVIGLVGQAIVAGIYMVNLEARVSTLEVRGSPHLTIIDNRLTVLESITRENKDRLERITEIMTRELGKTPPR
jgi:translation initiation factor 2 beta subunit (eIF-2beta)/eIF-5